jgi:hypothetical protein
MTRIIVCFCFSVLLSACVDRAPSKLQAAEISCTQQWFKTIEAAVPTGDGRGHGPDLGSEEWQSVVEFKLGIRDKAETPERNTSAWCRYVDTLVFADKSNAET